MYYTGVDIIRRRILVGWKKLGYFIWFCHPSETRWCWVTHVQVLYTCIYRLCHHSKNHLGNISWEPSTKHHCCVTMHLLKVHLLQYKRTSSSSRIIMTKQRNMYITLWLLVGTVTITQLMKMVSTLWTCATFNLPSKDLPRLVVGCGPGCTHLNINWITYWSTASGSLLPQELPCFQHSWTGLWSPIVIPSF